MPEEPRLVVFDSTLIIALSWIGGFDLLRSPHEQVVIPSAVEAEVLAGDRDGP